MSGRRKKKETSEVASDPASRRSFFWKIWLALGGLFILESIWVIVDFLRPRGSRAASDRESVVVAGPIERFEVNSVTAFQKGKFYLARMESGGFLAMSRECTHLGCTVPWVDEEKRFVCPCHASAYDIKGNVVSPPAPRALDLYAVRIENGIVKVDTSRAIVRSSFDANQVTEP
jgi:cytochrome b6-f complex iron-sulfur subunit